jgi:hypothetical protein
MSWLLLIILQEALRYIFWEGLEMATTVLPIDMKGRVDKNNFGKKTGYLSYYYFKKKGGLLFTLFELTNRKIAGIRI